LRWLLSQAPTLAADLYDLPPATGHLPTNIVVYQYEVCPFCCKVKAFLDYHKVTTAAAVVGQWVWLDQQRQRCAMCTSAMCPN
jgi:Glutaredoxin